MNPTFTPTDGEQKMLISFNQRMADIDRIAATQPSLMQPAAPTPGADSNGTLPGQAGYGQDGATVPGSRFDDALAKLNSSGGTRTERQAYGAAVSGMLRQDPSLASSDELESAMARAGTRTARGALGQAMASQLVRGFSRGGRACFADGGKIDPEELMRQIHAKYGAPAGGPAPVVQPDPQPAPVAPRQQPQPAGSMIQQAGNLLKGRAAQIDKAAGYALGGKIKGPGTATSDSIPGQITETGEPIAVSNGERIVSVQQEQLLERIAEMLGFESVDQLLASGTGKPVGPTIKRGKRAAATGMAPEDQFGQSAGSNLAPLNGQTSRQGHFPSKLEQSLTGAQVVPASPNLSNGDVGPSKFVQSVQADLARHRGTPPAALPIGNEGRAVPAPVTSPAQHPVSVPASRAAGSLLLGAEPIDNTPAQPLRTTDIANGGYADRGAGILAARSQNGRLNVTNVGTGDLTDASKPIMDGSASALIDQKNSTYNPARQLENMQRLRLMSDLTNPEITDPNVQQNARQMLGLMAAQDQVAGQNRLHTAQAGLVDANTEQAKQLEAMRGKLLDPSTPPDERARMLQALQAIHGHLQRTAPFQVHDVEEPIDPKQPLLGNRKSPRLFDPNSGSLTVFSSPAGQQGDVVAQARAAIARGADSRAVNARLRAMGLAEVK